MKHIIKFIVVAEAVGQDALEVEKNARILIDSFDREKLLEVGIIIRMSDVNVDTVSQQPDAQQGPQRMNVPLNLGNIRAKGQ